MFDIVIKLAFIFCDTNHKVDLITHQGMVPTYRISMQVHPTIKPPKVSAAISEIKKDGKIEPLVIIKRQL